MARLSGSAFNIGGGTANATSLLELIDRIAGLRECHPRVKLSDWRPGDQRYYATDFSKLQQASGWRPRVGLAEGISRLHEWLMQTRQQAPAELATA